MKQRKVCVTIKIELPATMVLWRWAELKEKILALVGSYSPGVKVVQIKVETLTNGGTDEKR